MLGDVDFTVVIPTLQEAGYIRRSLRNLRTARDTLDLSFDVVVVDGGSTDGTLEEISGLADAVVTDAHLDRAGIAHARNVGATYGRGRFLVHTDADVLFPDLAGLLARAVREFDDPTVVALTTPIVPYPWDSTRRDRLIHRCVNAYFRASMRFGAPFSRGECQIVRRTAFETVGGYDARLVAGEDCDLFRRLYRIGRIVYVPEMCVHHSPRRFHQVGYLRILGIYVREWLWVRVLHRSYVREWPVVR